jgi:transcriptional regulator
MYVPPHFSEDRVPILHEAMREIALATLVTLGPDGLIASHIPMVVDPEPAPYGTLYGHLARGNPQTRGVTPDVQALAIFLGPQAYITPSWYPTKQQTEKVVPTWNYLTVHAYGPIRFFDDPARLLAHVTRLTQIHEAPRSEPWAVSDAPADFIRAQLKGIIGFEVPITRLEGKWKMSQNRPAEDRTGVVEGLMREGRPGEATVAEIVAKVDRV